MPAERIITIGSGVRPDCPVRPKLPGKGASIEEIKAFYRGNRQVVVGLLFLRWDGTVISVNDEFPDVGEWLERQEFVAIDKGRFHGVALRSDGTVAATGPNGTVTATGPNTFTGECAVQDWRDIAAIACGDYFTVGLRSDGTIVATGESRGRHNVQNWRDIVAIDCESFRTVGLRSDGTVVATDAEPLPDGQTRVDWQESDIREWREIVSIACGSDHTVGLRSDGTVVARGANHDGRCSVQDWRDIVAIDCTEGITVGLRSDGTVVAAGNMDFVYGIQDWKNIFAIATSGQRIYAFLNDGSIWKTDYHIENRMSKINRRWMEIPKPHSAKTLHFKLF